MPWPHLLSQKGVQNMSIYRPLVAVFILSAAAMAAFGQKPAATARLDGKPDKSEYRQLLEKVKAGDNSVDFVKFRAAYLDWVLDECNVSDAPHRDDMVKAFEAKDYKTAVSLALPVLDYEYANRGLHLAVANAYDQLGEKEKARFHTGVADRLMKGLLASGDGKSAKTAFRVHSIREEYVVMRELGYQVKSQALRAESDRTFDVLSGSNSEGKTASLYFDITDVWIGSTSSRPCKKAN
jgi:hypothetical protein